MFDILYHNDLDIKSVEKTFAKTLKQLQTGDFKSADVKKMQNSGFYRARLDIRDRLLFNFVTYEQQKYVLLLEVIKDHNYAHSRFLRGASIDEDHFVAIESPETEADKTAVALTYLNKSNKAIHTLNKFISFDRFQEDVYGLQLPLIIVGSAGSGKTALVLEKLKSLHGNVAYISLSKYLVDNASSIYYSLGYDNENQETEFLSLKDYLALWQKPEGREVEFKDFERWFARHAQAVKINEPYRVYEEFKGVITGSPVHTEWLSREEYMDLGVKQSIFSLQERERLYPLFLKYVEWLKEERLYDSNMLCYNYLQKVQPYYDYIMVDEVQDITNIQLKCILASLKDKSHFILTGDSNQIVHPNFFSWSKIKTYFYETGDTKDNQIKILQTNYRNSLNVVELSNNLLKIKNTRFGSIDRESNYLVDTVSTDHGEVLLYANDEKKKNELNRRTQNSTKFAVIVPTNQQKAQASRFFKTPLIFSVQEAKGLEYENVILTDFVSTHEAEFREIIAGVTAEDLKQDALRYNRAADKHDKDAEIYKFYINSFYVAITRAVKNIYIFEQRADHPALRLLQMQETKAEIQLKEVKSSTEEWLDEANRLEEQGKYEQAEQIRAKYLGYEYISQEQLETIKALALDPAKKEAEVKKERKQLFQYAVNHRQYDWIDALAKLQFQRAVLFMKEIRNDRKEYDKHIRLGNKAKVVSLTQKYGTDFALEDNSTGLMLAATYGQIELLNEFLSKGASRTLLDSRNRFALDCLFDTYLKTKIQKQKQIQNSKQRQTYAQKQTASAEDKLLIGFWDKLKPQTLEYEAGGRLFKISAHTMLFFLILLLRNKQDSQTYKAVHETRPELGEVGIFDMNDLEQLAALIPDEILPPYRKKRTYINSVMALHEVTKDSPYCKLAFIRCDRGRYILDPELIYNGV
ncbi:UvrD-helicase domain-containing protein [Candidatus Symbiothrix dinenymphae]|uniref:UvrD-helicase domain-containing protein n=1 Tax=Candidatus Symbiothrix dinenymphae TaxID=467085 RepID=UPI0006C025DC|nr:UvrD-helicase domain-containing protein [Candidatus Symbiothrix dinenymphae]GAP72899.1 ankyrin repeat protein [Candidatus Symbiothrix dinenymphae]